MDKKIMPSAKSFTKTIIAAAILSTSLTGCGVMEKISNALPPLDSTDNYTYPEEANNIPVDSWANAPQTAQTQMPTNMAPAQGIKTSSIASNMSEPLGTEEIYQRFNVMEQQIAVMRQDMQRVAPLLQRLSMMEESMRELSVALNSAHTANSGSTPASAQPYTQLSQQQPMPMNALPTGTASMPTYTPPAATYTAPPQQVQKQAPAASSVQGIRFGKYKGRDRVVLDLSQAAQFRYDLDNNENLLIVDLPDASWGAQMAKKITVSGAVAAYNAQPGPNGGTQLIFSLKKDARVTQARALPPNQQYGHRIFMDIE
jgi:hypothetical protein|tara:strand:+ start:277003 stop:277944 length:942 start_codon:yes stop_codon:yes gene_type:complete